MSMKSKTSTLKAKQSRRDKYNRAAFDEGFRALMRSINTNTNTNHARGRNEHRRGERSAV